LNFLGHLYLADGEEREFIAGSIAAEFVRGRLPDTLPPLFAAAVRFHRRIDEVSDTHPAVSRSKTLLRPYGHYSAVIVDLFWDHLLASRWPEFSDEPLAAFTGRMYDHLLGLDGSDWPPYPLVVKRMAADDWLGSYATMEGLRSAVYRLSRRARRPVDFSGAAELLDQNREFFSTALDELLASLKTLPRR
jgi:acyl carrier protein phosphodiesterase